MVAARAAAPSERAGSPQAKPPQHGHCGGVEVPAPHAAQEGCSWPCPLAMPPHATAPPFLLQPRGDGPNLPSGRGRPVQPRLPFPVAQLPLTRAPLFFCSQQLTSASNCQCGVGGSLRCREPWRGDKVLGSAR